MSGASTSGYDIEFFWDPVCPFAWITSRWVEDVAVQTGMSVDWRFIALRLLGWMPALVRYLRYYLSSLYRCNVMLSELTHQYKQDAT